MKNKIHFSFNRLFNTLIIVGLLLVELSVCSFKEGDAELGVGLLFGAAVIIVSCVFIPGCYLFDRDGITLVYIFLQNERYLWANIYDIEVKDSDTRHKSALFFLFFFIYSLDGQPEGKQRFYMKGEIQKNTQNQAPDKKILGRRDHGVF